MSQRRARILFAAGVSSAALAGLAVSGSSGATIPDPVTESSEIITDTIAETGVTTAPGATPAEEPQPSCRSAETGPVVGPSHPGDGVADPAGRIAYAVVGRFDEVFGPIGTQLYAVDPDGSDRVLLLDCDVIRPQWSPDGSRLAFTIGLDDGSWQVATIAADGSDLQLLTSGPGIHEIPSWSPDGTWLAYDSSDVGLDDPTFRATLWRIDADGSDAALLGDPDTFDVEPRISPDGGQVAFMRIHPEADYASEIVVRDLASGDERVVVPLDVPVEHPEWSPDGSSLMFNALGLGTGRGDDLPDRPRRARGRAGRRARHGDRRRMGWRQAGLLPGRRTHRVRLLRGR